MGEHPDRRRIEVAIAAQEQLRGTLGDDIVDATIAALRSELATAAPAVPLEHERRLVTVLFLDVVDSTRIFQGMDPEEMLTVMDGALDTFARQVQAHGGRVLTFMGDGFLAVFGLRRTREDDAVMAVRAGLGILESARLVADEVDRSHNIAGFQVRIGVNTGLVVTGGVTETDTVMGSTVNLASRIETAAPPGGLLISQSTFRQVRGRFDLEPAGTIHAKGFPEPVPVHIVKGEHADADTGLTRGIEGIDIQMVGRREELGALLSALETVLNTRTGRTVTVVGDAGIGKSRLLTEFETHLPGDPSLSVFRARAGLEDSDVPHSLLRDLVERCFGIRGDDPVAVVRERLAAGFGPHLSAGAVPGAKIDVIGRFLGYTMSASDRRGVVPEDPQQLRNRAVAHLIEFFRDVAATNPAVLLIDDLHWADDSSVGILQEVVEELADEPVLTIALARPPVREAHPAWERLPNHQFVPLEPMPAADAESLIDAILVRVGDCPPELRVRLLENSGGNPYYLEELVMMCIDDGVIVIGEADWTVHMERLSTMRMPTTLSGVIRARLEGLPPPEHAVLQQAAVVGRVFWDDAVAKLARFSGTDTISGQLNALRARKMIDQRPLSTFSHAEEYAFSQTLLRDTSYEEVLLSNRREYHGMVADWLIAASGDREHEFAGLIAGHLEKAGRSAEALDYVSRAGDAARARYAVAAAADFYGRALALTPDEDLDRRYELLLGREKALALKGDRDEQRRALDELQLIADQIGDTAKQSLVAVERTFLEFYAGDYPAALASSRYAAEKAAATGDLWLQSRTETALGWTFFYLEDWDAARAHGEAALGLARRGQRADSEATAQNLLGMSELSAGDLSTARTRLTRALTVAQQGGDREAATIYMNNLAVVLTAIGDYETAHRLFSDSLEVAEEAGDRTGASTGHINLAWVAAANGSWARARAHAETGIAAKRKEGHREAEGEGLLWLGHALVGLGQLDEAAAAYEASAVIRRELGQTALYLGALAGLARVALVRGEVAEAMQLAEEILAHLDQAERLDGTWEPFHIHLTVVDVLTAAGDERMERVLRRAHRLLHTSAEQIADEEDRRLYLENIPWHRRIDEAAALLPG